MNGTVHALQPLQPLQPLQSLYCDSRPERAEVEAAIRTIIRWAGDDPEREGLIETAGARRSLARGILWRL
jgi:GTP cyclohydrolase I